VNFGEINVGRNQIYLRLSEQQFPDNWGQLFGRRAAMAGFRATDTGVTFTVSVYHAPPPANQYSTWAWAGVEALAKSADLYHLNMQGPIADVTGRLLAGDFNLDVNHDQSFNWLKNPVPRQPPPTQAGQGAGTRPIADDPTHLISLQEVEKRWGEDIRDWGTDPEDYLELPIDDIFYASPNPAPQPAGGVYNLLAQVMTRGTSLRRVAQEFFTSDGPEPAFPNAHLLPDDLPTVLSDPRCAWLLLRHAVSDHLPVYTSINI
jgi:hypothetical protein